MDEPFGADLAGFLAGRHQQHDRPPGRRAGKLPHDVDQRRDADRIVQRAVVDPVALTECQRRDMVEMRGQHDDFAPQPPVAPGNQPDHVAAGRGGEARVERDRQDAARRHRGVAGRLLRGLRGDARPAVAEQPRGRLRRQIGKDRNRFVHPAGAVRIRPAGMDQVPRRRDDAQWRDRRIGRGIVDRDQPDRAMPGGRVGLRR